MDQASTRAKVAEALEWMEKRGSKRNREGMARYGIVAKKVFGVPVGDVRKLGKQLGRDLFDKTPHAWSRIEKWSTSREEFVRRAAFALLASVALHDKNEGDEPFIESFDLIEAAASDDRNFVKKGVSWALRGIGHRNPALKAAAIQKARELARSDDSTARWIARDTLRDLTR